MQNILKHVVRQDILDTQAYQVQDRAGFIAMDAMESPFAWQGEGVEAECLRAAQIHRYPDNNSSIKQVFSQTLGLASNTDVLFGNGSDELLQILCSIVDKGSKVLTITPSFSMYEILAKQAQLELITCELREDFSVDIDSVVATIERHQPKLIFLASPNNPTGRKYTKDEITRILDCAQGLVVLDQAYQWFDGDLDLAWLSRPNAVVLGTFSKIGLAGLRFGFLLADTCWIDQLDKLRLPYNLNSVTQKMLPHILTSFDSLVLPQIAEMVTLREYLVKSLASCVVEVFPSCANFVLVRVEDANQTYRILHEANILVKNLHNFHRLTKNCLRVSIGTKADCDQLISVLNNERLCTK